MYFFFADDSKQNNPTRPRMGPLLATGGIFVAGDDLASLERSLETLCQRVAFPANEEFKWSPRRGSWMHHGLVDDARREFFVGVLKICTTHHATAVIILSDSTSRTPSNCANHEIFTTKMLIERVNNLAASKGSDAIIIIDRPGGGLPAEKKFLSECFETLRSGTPFVMPTKIAVNPIATDSHLIRTLQAADLIVSCTTAFISGQTTLAPETFEIIKPMLSRDLGRAGGVGVKIHPDFKYANLYHWLLGDDLLFKNMNGQALPIASRPYSTGPDHY
jgi:hypothetical protein